jgi:hypothetical protein
VRDARREEGGPSRQLLHCARLVVPFGEEEIDCTAELPGDFTNWL